MKNRNSLDAINQDINFLSSILIAAENEHIDDIKQFCQDWKDELLSRIENTQYDSAGNPV